MTTRIITASETLNESDDNALLLVDATDGNVVLSLPYAIAIQTFTVKRTDSTSNTVTLAPKGNDAIEGVAGNYTLVKIGRNKVTFASDQISNWWVTFDGEQETIVQDIVMVAPTSLVEWTDMPTNVTEFLGGVSARTVVNLISASQMRILVNVGASGTNAAYVFPQYSTDQSTWKTISGSAPSFAPSCSLSHSAVGVNTLRSSSWTNISSSAKQEVYLRVAGSGGNGANDPTLGSIRIQIK